MNNQNGKMFQLNMRYLINIFKGNIPVKIKVTKSLQDDGKFEYRIKVRKWLVWSIEYRSKDAEEIRVIYNRMLKSPNIEKA